MLFPVDFAFLQPSRVTEESAQMGPPLQEKSEFHHRSRVGTLNMKHAIELGDCLVMMHQGRIVLDVEGDNKKSLTIQQLMNEFAAIKVGEMTDD